MQPLIQSRVLLTLSETIACTQPPSSNAQSCIRIRRTHLKHTRIKGMHKDRRNTRESKEHTGNQWVFSLRLPMDPKALILKNCAWLCGCWPVLGRRRDGSQNSGCPPIPQSLLLLAVAAQVELRVTKRHRHTCQAVQRARTQSCFRVAIHSMPYVLSVHSLV